MCWDRFQFYRQTLVIEAGGVGQRFNNRLDHLQKYIEQTMLPTILWVEDDRPIAENVILAPAREHLDCRHVTPAAVNGLWTKFDR